MNLACYNVLTGLSPLIDGAWGRTCAECGNGMNLHLDNSNPQCICKQDSLCVPPGYSSSESYRAARGFPSRPKSSYSPRPPSASACSLNSTGSFSSTTTSFGVMPSRLRADKKLLRYTDGGIKRPVTPVNYPASNALPRLVRRYIGRRSIQCHELPLVNASSAVFIDTSQLNNPLSITPHGFPNRWRQDSLSINLKYQKCCKKDLFLKIFELKHFLAWRWNIIAGTTPCTCILFDHFYTLVIWLIFNVIVMLVTLH